MPGPVTLQTQLFQIASALSGLPGFLELSRVRLEDEPPGYQIGFQEATLQSEIMLRIAGARVYLVWAAAPKGSFEELETDFAKVMDSFKIALSPGSEPILTSVLAPETLDAIGERVSRIRGMSAPPDLKRRLQTRDEFASQAESQLLDETVRREMEVLKDLCLVLDLCSQSDDLAQLQLDLQRQGVLGFYEPGEGALTVVTDPQELEPLAWLTYAHEYTHALQDQEFDLSSFKPAGDTFDASKAFQLSWRAMPILLNICFMKLSPLRNRPVSRERFGVKPTSSLDRRRRSRPLASSKRPSAGSTLPVSSSYFGFIWRVGSRR